ncbi:hypothetical protein RB593_001511 [Gaeumannomyces tritici]
MFPFLTRPRIIFCAPESSTFFSSFLAHPTARPKTPSPVNQLLSSNMVAHHSFILLSLAALALGSPFGELQQRAEPRIQQRAACAGNTATTRSKWCDFDIKSDYYTGQHPNTGVTREFWLELTDSVKLAPDGVPRYAQAFNGTVPGPTLVMDWGDDVVIHVTNKLTQSINGTSVHWHGLHQKDTVLSDGVVSVTQCPAVPGTTQTYKFKATNYGSSWYHSHFALQAWQGVFGGIIINGPASANYDEDVGMVVLSDWGHKTPDELWHQAETQGPPTLENALINGMNVYSAEGNQTGKRWETSFESGKSYRVRLVNTAIDTHFKFGIDNHTLTVIALDFIPVEPYEATMINIGMGQRVDVIVKADQAAVASDFWMRAIPQSACGTIQMAKNTRAIVHYGASKGVPATTGHTYVDACEDEPLEKLKPIIRIDAEEATYQQLKIATAGVNAKSVFRWYLNSTTMELDWSKPTVSQLANNASVAFSNSNAVMELPEADKWAYVIIQTDFGVAHPVHLHGHDYSVLAQGSGAYQPGVTKLITTNPMRRDTAILPAAGHLVLAFKTDNPGAWLMHCHIGWHTAQGFAMQFVERRSEMFSKNIINNNDIEGLCEPWRTHVGKHNIKLEDSGI